MFLLGYVHTLLGYSWAFSSPIFGDMFLLALVESNHYYSNHSFRLLYSEICSYKASDNNKYTTDEFVFVSYIRRYVLTSGGYVWIRQPRENGVFVSYIRRYVLTNSYIAVSTSSFVFVSYIRRYVLTCILTTNIS